MKKIKKIFAWVSILSLVLQISGGIFIYQPAFAEEVNPELVEGPTPEATVTEGPAESTPEITPSAEPTLEPTPTIEPTLSAEPTPSIEPEVTTAPTPTEEVTPEPIIEDNQPASENSAPPSETSPPMDISPIPTVTPEQPEQGRLAAVILENVAANSLELDLATEDIEQSASLVTDKADYAPTDTVFISGSGFNANETYTLLISSTDEPPVNFETQITADETGAFVYAYQLDGTYRPNYKVEIKDGDRIVAVTTFTDSQEDYRHWQDEGSTGWINGALNASKSNYFEGETVPHYWKSQGLTVGNTYAFNIHYDYYWASQNYCGLDYLSQYDSSRSPSIVDSSPTADNTFPEGHGSFYTAGANITSVMSPTDSGDGKQRYVQVVFTATLTKAEFYWGFHLALPNAIGSCLGSNAWSGASLQTDVSSSPSYPGATMLGGGGSLQIQPGSIIKGLVSGYKWNDLDNDGIFDSEPKLSGWTIRLCSDANCNTVMQSTTTDGSGNYSFSVTPGTYYVGEVQQAGWSKTHPTGSTYGPLTVNATTPTFTNQNFGNYQPICGNNRIDAGEQCDDGNTNNGDGCSASCQIEQGTIIVRKDMVGGTDTFDFTGSPNGSISTDLGTIQASVIPGQYTSTEGAKTGWNLNSITCDDTNSTGDVGARAATFNVAVGETVTCTFTNTKNVTLTLVKTVTNDNGGNAVANDFQAKIDGNNVPWSIAQIVSASSHTASETTLAGYSASSWGGDCTAGGIVSLSPGENKTCTITNNDNPPSLTLNKILVKDNGGTASESDWTLTADGGSAGTLSGPGATGSTDVISGATFKAGTYNLSESTGPAGYTASSWSCVKNSVAPVTGNSITLALGDTATCTITNNDVAPTITLIKSVDNGNGGNAGVNDFGLTIGATSVTSGQTLTVDANTPYALDEAGLAGYNFVSIGQGANDSAKCPSVLEGTVTLNEGEDVTCTITNDDIAPQLTIVKDPTNDNGGNALPDNFLLTVGGNGVLSGVKNTYQANTPLALNETQLAGYTFVSITGDAKCPSVLGGTITLDEGDDITCTVTNNDVAPKLTLIKTVVNDNGGNKVVADFPLFISGTPATSGVAYDQTANVQLTATETPQTGYTPSVWGGDCAANGTITLLPGDNKTCYITNDDIQPQLTVIKHVINDSGGGNSVASDFTMSVTGDSPNPASFPGDENGIIVALNAGAYDVTETGPGGYAFNYSVDCSGNIAVGDNKTCTVTNDDLASPSISIAKTNDHLGGASAGDTVNYTLTLTNGPVPLLVDVVDVMPSGFAYIANSAKVSGVASEPTISGNVLTWYDVPLPADGTVEITYQAKIDGSQPAGTYYNLATCHGSTLGRVNGNHLANFEVVTNFVERTADCRVVDSSVPIGVGVSTSTAIGGTVLGITTTKVLGAATGSETYWLILAFLMILGGVSIMFMTKKRRAWLLKKMAGISKKLSAFSFFVFLVSCFFIFAGDTQAVVVVKVNDLPAYERTDNFKLYYTALDTENPSVSVVAYVKKDSGFDWKTFGGTRTDPSGYFEAFGYDLAGDGTYHFYVQANSVNSSETSTIVDRSGPEAPKDYRKSRESSTSYKIHWKNPGNDDYGWTRIFASTEQNFTADDATKKADVGGGKDVEFDYVVTGLEPNQDYYFALQGFDKAGNQSGLTGDGGTVTYEVTPAPTQAVAGVGEVVTLPKEEAGEGEILGGATEAPTPTEAPISEGVVAGITSQVGGMNKGWLATGAGILIILAGLGYFFYRQRSS